MIIKNKLDKSFGPVGSSAGLVIFILGIATTFSSLFGIFLIVTGAFVGFSSTTIFIDATRRRIKFSNTIFGIVPLGRWIPIEIGMKIGIKESNLVWTAYSRSNRSLDIDTSDFRLILFNSEGNEIMPLKKVSSLESAIAERRILCSELGLHESD